MCVGFQVNESIPVFEFEMCPPCEGGVSTAADQGQRVVCGEL